MAQRLGFYEVRVQETPAGLELLDRGVAMAAPKSRSHVRALLDRASANLWLARLAQWHFARGEPAASLSAIDSLLQDIGYPSVRIAKRLASILTLKSRAELALGRTAAALATAESAVAIAEGMSLDPQSSASVGAALMVLAETRRALGDSSHANAAAQRAGQALTAALGPAHSETRAALTFR